jgi:hypothetical protein
MRVILYLIALAAMLSAGAAAAQSAVMPGGAMLDPQARAAMRPAHAVHPIGQSASRVRARKAGPTQLAKHGSDA